MESSVHGSLAPSGARTSANFERNGNVWKLDPPAAVDGPFPDPTTVDDSWPTRTAGFRRAELFL